MQNWQSDNTQGIKSAPTMHVDCSACIQCLQPEQGIWHYIFFHIVWSSPCQGCVVCTAPHWMRELLHWPRPQRCGGTVQAHWGCQAAPDPSWTNRENDQHLNMLSTLISLREYWLVVAIQTSHFLIRPVFWLRRERTFITLRNIKSHNAQRC